MSRFKTVKTILSTMTIAVAVGFVMQYGETAPNMQAGAENAMYNSAPRTLMMSTNAQGEAVFGVPNVVMTPLNHAANVQPVVAVDVVYTELDVPVLGTIMATPIIGCQTTLTTKRQPAALVELTIDAPCFANSTFTVRHNEMLFSGVTDRTGTALVTVPVLTTDAMFYVAFDNIVQASTEIFVPELRQYDRAVLQWEGTENMRLHALEGGAQIGDPGHVWSASIHTAEDARSGRYGFVVYLGIAQGELSYQAEVYTFPAGQMNTDAVVDLLVGVSVNEANCGREVDATTIQTNAAQTLVTSDVAIKMPDCDQIGQVALISDKFADLTLAAR
ncbi:MAG: hypothetical protein NWQ23_15200 [Yoonia sp.]|uniref:hypothetical protein n=1 Tax=Yoonia sp. TaxID=2212373 RepID=UPI00273EE6DE|nr:hypothetical protein [Yoonia sp.]MDP5086764.1 hypothetical protein [Yoonia sp.]MDP5360488.1 hypothetical protein [Paracoccaceae bacterium]MDP5362231.1 hypothetical protein [Paracoccaceae bacterium]